MTKAERTERSRQRAQEYHRRRRVRLTILAIAAALYIVVPLLWYGGVEFGFVHEIRTPEFKHALTMASLALLVTISLLGMDFLKLMEERRREKNPDQEADVPTPPAVSSST